MQSRFGQRLWLGALLLNLLMLAAAGLVLWASHQDAEQQARRATENYARILEANLSGFLKRIDGVLLNTSAELERQYEIRGKLDSQAIAQLLNREDALLPETLGLRIVDSEGIIRHTRDSQGGKPQPYVGDRPYFIQLRDNLDSGLVISKPLTSRVTGASVITMARRVNYPDGRFAGAVHVAVPTSYFVEQFSQLDLGSHGNSGFWDKDSLIARYSKADPEGAKTGAKTPSLQLRELLNTQCREAFYQAESGIDGILRLYHFRKVDSYPVFVLVGLADADYLAEWHSNLWRTLLVLALFASTTLFFTYLAHRGWQQQVQAQRQLRLLNRELEQRRQEAEAAHQQSQLILSSAGEGICGVDRDGNLVFVNQAASTMFGWESRDLIDHNLHQLTHGRHPDGAIYPAEHCPVNQTLADGVQRKSANEHFWRKDGSVFPVEFTVAAQRLRDSIVGAVIVFRDVSERRQSEAELAQYRRNLEQLVDARTAALLETEQRASHILASSASGLFGIDADGRITFINPAACTLLGLKAETAVGQPAHSLFHHHHADGRDYPDQDCPSYATLRAGNRIRVDNEVYWHADGHPIPVMYATHPMEVNGKIVGAVTSFVDISEQRAAAEAREQALLAAEQLVRARSEFLANMSHEIRTPLNGILGFADLGQRHCDDPEDARDAFAKISQSGQRLLGVINDILDFSKIEAGRLDIEQTSVYLPEVIYQATELISPQASSKGLKLEVTLAPELPEYCISDPLRLGQVLLNLLSNAVKFTHTGSIILEVWKQASHLHFKVADTGIGISPEHLAHLFTPFQQADASSTRRFGGTGLGLAISKRILELMSGDIRAESEPGKGSCFEFSIPYQPLAVETLAQTQHKPQLTGTRSLNGLRILVAEDDPLNQAVLAENLLEEGAELTVTANGKQAVEAVTAAGCGHFDVVLMDLQMPEMDGYEATRQILALDATLPVMAQTAHAFTEERERCLTSGMVAHIAKPIDPETLFASILQYARKQPPAPAS